MTIRQTIQALKKFRDKDVEVYFRGKGVLHAVEDISAVGAVGSGRELAALVEGKKCGRREELGVG